jgi:glycerate 2-kinase
MPRVVVIGQAFKGSLSAADVARALGEGAAAAGASTTVIVGSDGGDGLLDAIAAPRRSTHRVTGPLGEPVEVAVGWIDARTAVIESRLACGVALIPWERRDPERTTTRGVGELLSELAAAGATDVIVGLGGSATMDGGLGAARAWGWRARDDRGTDLPDGGGALEHLHTLEPSQRLGVAITALADVRNPLLGPGGAAVFARQKGATPEATTRLMAGLQRLVDCSPSWDGPVIAERPGAGAAGGLGFGLACFGGARLEPGAAWVLGRAGFAAALGQADAVVVAEATFDATSLAGKLTGEVVSQARAAGVPVAVITPRPLLRPPGVLVLNRRGHWRPADVATMCERAARRLLRLPRP